MLTPGHIATSYLIVEGARNIGVDLNNEQILLIILSGNVLDVDFLVGLFNGKKGELHHQNITHTPVGALIVGLLLVFIFQINVILAALIFLSLFIHLFLDDLSHILSVLKIYKKNGETQINWFWPITKYPDRKVMTSNKEILKYYLTKAWLIASLEIICIAIALFCFYYEYSDFFWQEV